MTLLVQTFDKVIDALGKTQTRNSTALWSLSDRVTLFNSTLFAISINVTEESFPN